MITILSSFLSPFYTAHFAIVSGQRQLFVRMTSTGAPGAPRKRDVGATGRETITTNSKACNLVMDRPWPLQEAQVE